MPYTVEARNYYCCRRLPSNGARLTAKCNGRRRRQRRTSRTVATSHMTATTVAALLSSVIAVSCITSARCNAVAEPADIDASSSSFDWPTLTVADRGVDDDDGLSPVRIDGHRREVAGKMIAFYVKLNSLRREHRERRRRLWRKSGGGHEHGRRPPWPIRPQSDFPGAVTARRYTSAATAASSPPPPPPPPPMSVVDGRNAVQEPNHEMTAAYLWDGPPGTQKTAAAAVYGKRRPAAEQPRSAAGRYLRMGWWSARCLWHRYWEAATELDALSAREQLVDVVRFWAVAVTVSVTLAWAAFGFFHGLFCACVAAPPDVYAKRVNKYLTIVPPHVVVTDRGKVFRYRPTIEERFLWESAKKMANFKI